MTDERSNVDTSGADDQLLAWLTRVAAEADPVPGLVHDAARAAFAMRDLDGELAILLADSAAEAGDATPAFEAVRGAAGAAPASRMLAFDGGGVRIDVEINHMGRRLDLVGQVTGARPDACAVEYTDRREYPVELDDLGRFLLTGMPPGVLRLRCRSTSGVPVRTAWITT